MIENTQVTGLLTNNDETVTVQTASGSEFNAKKLIMTAGAWTNKILQQSTGLKLPLEVREFKTFPQWGLLVESINLASHLQHVK